MDILYLFLLGFFALLAFALIQGLDQLGEMP